MAVIQEFMKRANQPISPHWQGGSWTRPHYSCEYSPSDSEEVSRHYMTVHGDAALFYPSINQLPVLNQAVEQNVNLYTAPL